MGDFMLAIPSEHRDASSRALTSAFGSHQTPRLAPVRGGASGALTYHVDVGGQHYLLRIEGPRRRLRNPHQCVCLETAAAADIAPPVRYLDAEAGVVIMDWVPTRSLADYPGGLTNLVGDLGELLSRLHATRLFPELRDYCVVLTRLASFLQTGIFAPGLLDAHVASLQQILDAYPWDAPAKVSSHNDPNPRNILFDGRRLWLVDWETAYRNDPWIDVAIVADHFALSADLEAVLLPSALGVAPTRATRSRLLLARMMTRFYYAGLLMSITAAACVEEPLTDLEAPTESELQQRVRAGTLSANSPDMLRSLGKMRLASFLSGVRTPEFADAIRTVQER